MAQLPVQLSLSDRYALVGKTRSGKTVSTLILVSLLLPFTWPPKSRPKLPWQVWWVDTKGDPRDYKRLLQWGFRSASKAPQKWPRVVFRVKPIDLTDELSVPRQVQAIAWAASRRGNVLLVIDEYVSCVLSSRSMGAGLKNVSQRGGGLRVGLVGGTQEPVGVPRQLLSQATHEFLFNVTFRRDIDWCNDECEVYGNGPPDKHGFYYRWLDGDKSVSRWLYFPDITEFRSHFDVLTEASA